MGPSGEFQVTALRCVSAGRGDPWREAPGVPGCGPAQLEGRRWPVSPAGPTSGRRTGLVMWREGSSSPAKTTGQEAAGLAKFSAHTGQGSRSAMRGE